MSLSAEERRTRKRLLEFYDLLLFSFEVLDKFFLVRLNSLLFSLKSAIDIHIKLRSLLLELNGN
jgi:hypothetical protein